MSNCNREELRDVVNAQNCLIKNGFVEVGNLESGNRHKQLFACCDSHFDYAAAFQMVSYLGIGGLLASAGAPALKRITAVSSTKKCSWLAGSARGVARQANFLPVASTVKVNAYSLFVPTARDASIVPSGLSCANVP
jgi:hypothetical protein